MDLKTYTNELPRGGVGDFARRVGVTPVYLSQLSARQDDRVPSPELCVAIERETAKKVTRQELRPDDWRRIWPELVTPDHPAPARSSPLAA